MLTKKQQELLMFIHRRLEDGGRLLDGAACRPREGAGEEDVEEAVHHAARRVDLVGQRVLGADRVVSARGFMFALGFIQALKCNKNTCPTGITTHDRRLQRGLNPADKAEKVAAYARQITEHIEVIAHSCGVEDAAHLERYHVRVVLPSGLTERADRLFPVPPPTQKPPHA